MYSPILNKLKQAGFSSPAAIQARCRYLAMRMGAISWLDGPADPESFTLVFWARSLTVPTMGMMVREDL